MAEKTITGGKVLLERPALKRGANRQENRSVDSRRKQSGPAKKQVRHQGRTSATIRRASEERPDRGENERDRG